MNPSTLLGFFFMPENNSYKIVLPEFEGPFDLLLFFIERDELDIYDIPIVKITKDFLDYMQQMEQLNIELASEFILFASMLIRIKARTLLPRKEKDEEGNDIDPREELVNKLIEYKQYKELSEKLKGLEAERLLQQSRGNAAEELDRIANEAVEGTEVDHLDSYKLARAFERVMKRFKDRTDKPTHVVKRYNYSIESQRKSLADFMLRERKASFVSLFDDCDNRVHAIFNFLAMLEMIQLKYFNISLGEGRNNFYLSVNDQALDKLQEISVSDISSEKELPTKDE